MRSARVRIVTVQRMDRGRRVVVLRLGPRNTKLRVGVRACAAFLAIIVLAGVAGFLLNERIEQAEQGGIRPGLWAELSRNL